MIKIKRSEWNTQKEWYGIWERGDFRIVKRETMVNMIKIGRAKIINDVFQLDQKEFDNDSWFVICRQLNIPPKTRKITMFLDKINVETK